MDNNDIVNEEEFDLAEAFFDGEEKERPLALLETLWFGLDYGSILTAFALYNTVRSFGWDAHLMNKPPELWTDHYADPDNIAGKFIYKYCEVEPVADDPSIMEWIVYDKDAFIVGSDVIWSYKVCGKQSGKHYFLDYVPEDRIKLSYATSFGYSYSGPYGDDQKACGKLLSSFDAVSVNNYISADILYSRFGIDGETVLDPVFLCSTEEYEKAAANAPCRGQESDSTFIFTYIKGGSKRKREFVLLGNDILASRSFSPMRSFIDINAFPESREMFGLDVAFHITVEDWLYYMIHSEFVITDDYYGVCFAIIFNKPFVFIDSLSYDGLNNVYALLSSLGLEDRMVNVDDDFKDKEYLFRMPIRYNKVNRRLSAMREQSAGWLRSRLPLNEKEAQDIG